ncbi:MAG: hypothetical protein JXR97_14455 [Planctomycetes bacterium]|nr:hypothetical protein [Planctomycetota bacterium]
MNPETCKLFLDMVRKTSAAPISAVESVAGEQPQSIPSLLVTEHGGEKSKILDILSDLYGVPAVDLDDELVETETFKEISPDLCMRCLALPLRLEEGHAIVAFADPENIRSVDDIQAAIGKPLRSRVALSSDIYKYLQMNGELDSVNELVAEILKAEDGEEEPPIRLSTQSEAMNPVVKLLDRVIQDAVRRKGLHLYIIPFGGEEDTRVRLSLEDKIVETHRYPARLHAKLVNRLRVLCDLVGKDKRVPQNGAYLTLIDGVKHRIDVMITPAPAGDAITIFFDQAVSIPEGGSEKPLCAQCAYELKRQWKFCPNCGKSVK